MVSFDRGNNGGWKLSEVLSFELENGTVTTDDLLEALNFKVELLNNPELLDWCDVVIGFDNQQLPVFCGVNIAERTNTFRLPTPLCFIPIRLTALFGSMELKSQKYRSTMLWDNC